jgi:hypothetical protein
MGMIDMKTTVRNRLEGEVINIVKGAVAKVDVKTAAGVVSSDHHALPRGDRPQAGRQGDRRVQVDDGVYREGLSER